MLEGGIPAEIWKMKSPIIICPLGGGGFAVDISGHPQRDWVLLTGSRVKVSKTGGGRIRIVV